MTDIIKEETFVRKYLSEHNGKIDSNFINQYLGTMAILEYLISRKVNPEEIGKDERISNIQNVYMQGIIDQDVRDCDFSALTQEEFEMLKFSEETQFNEETISRFHTNEILARKNTTINSVRDDNELLHIAILDGPIENLNNTPNLIIKNYEGLIKSRDSYHGRSVYSIFSSINPNCVVHFYGTSTMYAEERPKTDDEYRMEALEDIVNYNRTCGEKEKIRVISCSHTLSEGEKKIIEENQLNVISADNLHGDFSEYFKFTNKDVIPSLTEAEKKYLQTKYPEKAQKIIEMISSMNNSILVNVNLTIEQHYKNIKRHECAFSVSWGVPIVAAYYSIALKENPNMSYEEFLEVCKRSLKRNTNIFDENLFMENIKQIKIEQSVSLDSGEKFPYLITPTQIGKATIGTSIENKVKASEVEREAMKRIRRTNSNTRIRLEF